MIQVKTPSADIADYAASTKPGLQSQWIEDCDIPNNPRYKNTWRYILVDKNRVWGEYTDKKLAYEMKNLYGKGFYIINYEPTLEEVLLIEEKRRTERRYQSGFGG